MSLLCFGPSVQNCHRQAKIVDMSDERTDQSMRTTFVFADSSEVFWHCHPRPGTVIGFRTKGRATDLNSSSMYK